MDKLFKNNENIVYIFLIVLFCTVLFCFTYARFGMFFIDTSREVYMPMAMNNGSVLYKDIFNIFTPLSYQINAFLFKMFGENLRTLYFSGFFNSIIFSVGLFYLSSMFFKNSKLLSFLFCTFIISSCIYSVSLVNYIFPYSYSMVYSLSAIVWALYSFLIYIKYKNIKYLIFAFFLFGLCISLKYDFILFIFALLFSFFDKEVKLKDKLYCLIAFCVVPLFSFILLFIQGISLTDIKEAVNYIILLLNSPASLKCYKLMGIIPSFESLKILFINFIKTLIALAAIFAVSYRISRFSHFRNIILLIFSLIVILILKPVFYLSNSFYFNWMGIFAVIELFFLSVYFYKKGNFSIDDKLFLILFISVILISVKSLSSLSFNGYGTYYLPLISLCVFSSLYYYLNKYVDKTSFCVVFIILIFCYTISNFERRVDVFNSPIITSKGTIYVGKIQAPAINKAIEFIQKNTKTTDKILVLPEGAMLNFLTNRISDDKYFHLIPPNIEVLNEDSIVNDLKNNLPDYVVLQPMSYNNFNETYFCESFGTKICSLLPQYYESPVVFGKDFWIAIYKKKVINENK